MARSKLTKSADAAASRPRRSRKPARRELLLKLSASERAAFGQCYRLRPVARQKVDDAVAGPVRFTKNELQAILDEIRWVYEEGEAPRIKPLLKVRERVVELLEQDAPDAFGAEHLQDSPKTLVRTDLYFQFHVELLNMEHAVWRRIRVPDCTLMDLHRCIQGAFGWEDCHLHEFIIDGLQFAPLPPEDYAGLSMPTFDEAEPHLSQLVPRSGKQSSWLYTYDFGDDWHHEIVFEGCVPLEPRKRYPYCLEGARACPPEDIGGPWCYPELLEALANRRHERHKELTEWFGGFDPEAFDVKQTTATMRKWFRDDREGP